MTGGPNGSATGKHIAEADKFWDISSLVPERARTAPRDRKTDTTTAKIDLDGAPEKAGEPIPEKKPEKNSAAPRREIEYEGSGPVSRVRVTPWPTGYTFYSRFAAQAAALWRKKCAKCDPVNFFSYMPQYDQMTTAQLKYYLYWRDLVRHGEYPHVECSYVLLYLYEIINLPKLIPVHVGATLIALVWAAYRDAYPYLDKYAGEWLCDYCMIYDTPVPTEIVAPFLSDAAPKLTFPEYLSGGGTDFDVLLAASGYDCKKSKYYADNKQDFDKHIPAAAKAGCDALFEGGIYESIQPVRFGRDSFSGAVVCFDAKYKIEVLYRSVSKSRAVRDAVTSVIKACENRIRAEKGIKSRFSKVGLPASAAQAIDAYFDAVYPRGNQKKKKDAESEEYMKLYEPAESGTADIARAMKIESDAWQTAIDLDGENIVFDDDVPPELFTEPKTEAGGDGFADLAASLGAGLITILKAALDGDYAAACAAQKIAPAEAERLINETSFDFIGDAVVSGGKVIPDYEDDVKAIVNASGGNNG